MQGLLNTLCYARLCCATLCYVGVTRLGGTGLKYITLGTWPLNNDKLLYMIDLGSQTIVNYNIVGTWP